jgi:biopolymer transport protein ExbD
MAMSVKQDGDSDESPMSEINTTPLVDVMLVLLIIFLITIPVVKQTQPHVLPKVANIETQPKPENIELVITEKGEYFEGARKYDGPSALKAYIISRVIDSQNSGKQQPEVHIRADRQVRFDAVGRAIYAVQQGGILKVAFLTEPPPR